MVLLVVVLGRVVVSFCIFFSSGYHQVALADLEVTEIPLPLLYKCWVRVVFHHDQSLPEHPP